MSSWISQGVMKGADGATGPAGGVFGSTIADFGSSDNGGADAMSVTVTVAAAWVTSTSYPIVEIGPGGDHLDADDLTSEEVYALVTNIVIGVSFDIEVFAPNGTWGQWLVNWGAALTGATVPPHAATHSNGVDNVTLAESQITNLVTDLAAKTPTSRTITAGDGMTGGGDLSANRSLAVDGTVGRTGGTSHYYDYDELLHPTTPKFCVVGNGGGSGAVSASQSTQVIAGRNGIYLLGPGTTANLGAYLYSGPVFLTTGVTVTWRAQVWIGSNVLTSAGTNFVVGLASVVSTQITSSQYYVVIYCIPNASSNWQAQNRALTAFTNVDTGVVATVGSWFDLKIVASSTSVAFYVNGVLTNTITTNIPASTIPLYPSVFVNAAATTINYGFYVDSVEIDLDSSVAGKFFKSSV